MSIASGHNKIIIMIIIIELQINYFDVTFLLCVKIISNKRKSMHLFSSRALSLSLSL